jgi:hypothetical protein
MLAVLKARSASIEKPSKERLHWTSICIATTLTSFFLGAAFAISVLLVLMARTAINNLFDSVIHQLNEQELARAIAVSPPAEIANSQNIS